MWLGFTVADDRKFILKIYAGGVNALNGEALTGNMNNLLQRANALSEEQDYIVLPHQRWLDGICTSPGIVKQFVATSILLESATTQEEDDDEDEIHSSKNLSNLAGLYTSV